VHKKCESSQDETLVLGRIFPSEQRLKLDFYLTVLGNLSQRRIVKNIDTPGRKIGFVSE
jgi:hypothetical protein